MAAHSNFYSTTDCKEESGGEEEEEPTDDAHDVSGLQSAATVLREPAERQDGACDVNNNNDEL